MTRGRSFGVSDNKNFSLPGARETRETSGNKRGARYLPFTCCTCVPAARRGVQRRVETLLPEAAARFLLLLLLPSRARSLSPSTLRRSSPRLASSFFLSSSRTILSRNSRRSVSIASSSRRDRPSTYARNSRPVWNLFLVGARRTVAIGPFDCKRNTFLDHLELKSQG